VWTRTDVPEGLGLGTLTPRPDGYVLEAGETVVEDGEAFSTRFGVETDLAWVTRRVHVEVLSANGSAQLELTARDGSWARGDGTRLPDLVGCFDVDVAATPLTNTLPVRRLGLRPGEHRDIAVAWVHVPSLEVRRVRQRYLRHGFADGLDHYTYADPEHGRYRLSVDTDGLVVDYEGLARRLPSHGAAGRGAGP